MWERNCAGVGGRRFYPKRHALRRNESRLLRRCHPEGAPPGTGADPILSGVLLVRTAGLMAAIMGDRVLMHVRGRDGCMADTGSLERRRGGKGQQQEKPKPASRGGRHPTPRWHCQPCPKPLHCHIFGRPADHLTVFYYIG